MNPSKSSLLWKRCVQWISIALGWLVVACLSIWAVLALYFDLSTARLHILVPFLYILAIVVLGYFAKRPIRIMGIGVAGFFACAGLLAFP